MIFRREAERALEEVFEETLLDFDREEMLPYVDTMFAAGMDHHDVVEAVAGIIKVAKGD